MKLELKHLAGYLPYGLKTKGLTAIYPDPIITGILGGYGSRVYWNYHGATGAWKLEDIKPILRPLSDLIKEIEVKGVKLIPADNINREFFWDYVRNNMRALVKDESYILVGYLPALAVDKLLEWHFDIYGLIENGLAIDINIISVE